MGKKCLSDIELQNYLDKTISELEKEKIEKHLSLCEKCNRRLKEYKLLFYGLSNFSVPKLPYDFTQKALEFSMMKAKTYERRRIFAKVVILITSVMLSLFFLIFQPIILGEESGEFFSHLIIQFRLFFQFISGFFKLFQVFYTGFKGTELLNTLIFLVLGAVVLVLIKFKEKTRYINQIF